MEGAEGAGEDGGGGEGAAIGGWWVVWAVEEAEAGSADEAVMVVGGVLRCRRKSRLAGYHRSQCHISIADMKMSTIVLQGCR